MNLIEESYKEKQERPKKMMKVILVVILVFLILIFTIIGVLIAIKPTPETAQINGTKNDQFLKLIRNIGEKEYVPIKDLAQLLDYSFHNGEYNTLSESTTECYVERKDASESIEVVNLTLESNKIYKLDLTKKDADYEPVDMNYPVKSNEGVLCISVDDIVNVFNTVYSNDTDKKVRSLATLPYLINYYTKFAMDKGYELDETFANQKAILKGMLVVTKKDDKTFGIIDANSGEELIGVKYASVEYLSGVGDCIVSDSKKKYGIISPKGQKKTKIEVIYDGIELLDVKTNLYVVQKDDKYGIVDTSGKTKVPTDFDQIGIDATQFQENNIKNKYLLLENLIPVKKGEKWALSDINGNVVAGLEYDDFGYKSETNKDALNLLVIPDYGLIVVRKGDKYGLIDRLGKLVEAFGVNFDDIYMTKEAGEYNYFANYNDRTETIGYYLDQIGVKASQSSKSSNNVQTKATEQPAVENENQEVAPEQQILNLQQEQKNLEEQAQQRQLTAEEEAYLNQLNIQIETLQQQINPQVNQQEEQPQQ